MIVSINQPAYLPWLGYFDRIACSDIHVVLDHVQFEKNSMVNRNKIITANGETMLTVPLNTKNKFGDLAINTVTINEQNKWQKKHWDSIRFSYSKSPYFKEYGEQLNALYQQPLEILTVLLKQQLDFFMPALGINTKIIYSSSMNLSSTKSQLVLDICKQLGASHYISGIFGKDYLDQTTFKEAGITVTFQDYQHPEYKQFNQKTFIPYASTLDLLMNVGDGALDILKTTGKLDSE